MCVGGLRGSCLTFDDFSASLTKPAALASMQTTLAEIMAKAIGVAVIFRMVRRSVGDTNLSRCRRKCIASGE